MKKSAHRGAPRALLGAIAAVALLLAAMPAHTENIDLIVMVDTSASMFPYFDDLMNYLVHDLLASRLHRGDTFHLLSFDSTPEVEIALEINSAEASDRAFGRILLLHPLGRYTDLVGALQFLYKYAKELPETNPKQIILITDGVHDPPPGSPNRLGDAATRQAINDVAGAMKKEGWTFNILKVPPEPAPGEEGLKSYLSDLAQKLGVPVVPYHKTEKEIVTGITTGFPSLIFPPALGKVGNRFVAPFRVKNWKTEPIIVKLSSVQSDGTELLDGKVSITVAPNAEAPVDVPIHLPLSYPPGDHAANVQLFFQNDLRISPTSGTLSFTYTGKGGLPLPRLTYLYIVYIILALALLYALIRLFLFLRKKMQEAPESGFAKSRVLPAAGARESRRAAAERAQAAGGAGAARPGAGKRVPLLSTGIRAGLGAGTEHEPAGIVIGGKRVRPTVTSLRRALPRSELQEGSLPPLIEMRVSLQNHQIGFRNVHRIPVGGVRNVGGGFSAYLIFLVRVPASIAEIRNQDGKYVFTPLKAEMFPGLGGPVEDCLGKEIPFVGPQGREMSLHFRQWVSPLEEINRIMRSVRHEGA
ncbi:MAG: vWA domain-containing protein [Spirochaetia bacterium]|jgi:Mg-chelatase subunit ChlD